MKLVLLSGGSGKRLWPLSNDSRSKQFLKVLRHRDGHLESMLQRVWRQLKQHGLAENASIATGKAQLDMILNQLGPEASIIIEPERRDTFPAIALACVYLYSIEGIGLGETIAVLPVDPYVEDDFFAKVKQLDDVLQESGAELALLGVQPTYPSEKYGYIVPRRDRKAGDRPWFDVATFEEKPCRERAEELIARQALWNCGVFAFKLDYMINLLIQLGLPIQYDEMMLQYGKMPKTSFDYAVVEKAERVAVLPYEGTWKDLGTWNTLTEEIDVPLIGKGTISDDCTRVHVINELDIPVAVLGVHNLIISASPDGILVADKQASPRLKETISHLEQRPMYEERRWGSYRVLDYKRFDDGREVLTKRIRIAAGKNLSYQMHYKRTEVWTIISGEGDFVLDGRLSRVKAGDVVQIPVQAKHSIRAETDLELIEVQSGSELTEEDIIRLNMIWEEIVELCK